MSISARACEPDEIALLREKYRTEMDCQIIHDSIHERPGWTEEYIVERDGTAVGYGSVAIAGPWSRSHAVYEFYVQEDGRRQIFDLFAAFLTKTDARTIETQTNDSILTTLLHTFTQNIRAESILFEDQFETQIELEGAGFRSAEGGDVERLKQMELDDAAGWVVTWNGTIAGAGGVLFHYNRPYGDVYMKIAEPFRKRKLGSFLVQELKRACKAGGSVPAARCSVTNVASRRTLQKAGFVPCGNLITGDLAGTPSS